MKKAEMIKIWAYSNKNGIKRSQKH